MSELLMPSEARKGGAAAPVDQAAPSPLVEVGEVPGMKMVVRLFLIPLLIAAAVIGIMIPIGRMAGGPASLEQAIEQLKKPGGEKTLGLIGPGSKQRYEYAKSLVDFMKSGLNEQDRIKLADQLIDILQNHTNSEEGDVQQFVLLALGRTWQKDPRQSEADSPAAVASREKVVGALSKYFDAPSVQARKAAVLALAFWKDIPQARAAAPALAAKVLDEKEDVDVRIAAAAALGNAAGPEDKVAIDALNRVRSVRKEDAELAWTASLSLAKLGEQDVADTVLMLMTRSDLKELDVFDRETDPRNPVFRKLNELEQQRFIMNAMEAGKYLHNEKIIARMKEIAQSDPAMRVRAAAREMMQAR